MSNPETSVGEQPAENAREANGAQPDATETTPDSLIEGMSAEELTEALWNESPETEPRQTKATTTATQPEPEPEGEQPGDTTQPETPDGDHGRKRRRISLGGIEPGSQQELAQIAEMLRTGQAKDTLDALQQIRGVQQSPPPESQANEAEPEAAPPSLDDQLGTLREQLRQAEDNYEVDQIRTLNIAIQEKILEIAEERAIARLAKKEGQEAAMQYEDRIDANLDALEAKYPDLADETTPFARLLDDKIEAAKARKDPALADPDFIVRFADDLAATLNINAGNRTSSKPSPPPARATRPVGSTLAPGHSSPVPMTESQALHLLESATPEEIEAALYGT